LIDNSIFDFNLDIGWIAILLPYLLAKGRRKGKERKGSNFASSLQKIEFFLDSGFHLMTFLLRLIWVGLLSLLWASMLIIDLVACLRLFSNDHFKRYREFSSAELAKRARPRVWHQRFSQVLGSKAPRLWRV
jgi:hypothetical protein